MCGLVGVAGNISMREEKIFRTLLILDSVRGEHSTGIASVGFDDELIIAKSVGDPYQLLETNNCEAIFRRGNKVLMGHNRFATTGKITRRNAHPFDFPTIVGMHNGTLTNKHSLPEHIKYDVDSEALLNLIDKEGAKESIAKAKGAWALVWYDKEAKVLNFLRNKERTLYACYNEKKDCIFWASEIWMLLAALQRNDVKHGNVFFFSEDKHYELPINGRNIGSLQEEACPGAPSFIYESKKKQTVASTPIGGQKLSTSPDITYLGTTNTYKILSPSKDTDGVAFMYLTDPCDPSRAARLYDTDIDLFKKRVGEMIKGLVVGIKKGERAYNYRVSFVGNVPKIPDVIRPTDKSGNIVSEEDHFLYYHTCSWCNSPVTFDEKGLKYLDKTNGVVCSTCQEDPTIAAYL